MTIEATLLSIDASLKSLLEKFDHVGAATAPAAPAPKTESTVSAPPAPETPANLDYDKDIKPIALALAKKNREALTKIWGQLGVKVGGELKPVQFAEAKALIEKASA